MNELIPHTRVSGSILLDSEGYLRLPKVNPVEPAAEGRDGFSAAESFSQVHFRKRGLWPQSFGDSPPIPILGDIVEKSLKGAALWEEVADHLHGSATDLSLGQQQRLCIARVLAMQPEVILMDEPCSALDPQATLRIEELMQELKRNYTIVIVTHNMQQAARASDWVGFFLLGELLEYGATKDVFTNPKDPRTESYITGRYG